MSTSSKSDTSDKIAELEASKAAAMDAYQQLLEAQQHFRKAAEAAGVELKQDALDQVAKGRDKVDQVGEQARTYVHEKPLASIGIALLVGYVIAQIFSRK